ncbi:MAG: insulinase family protein [Candidatus Aminicenantes bacterium]|nr:insulinase family protein [Candidatus Aminicenantes bacterium]
MKSIRIQKLVALAAAFLVLALPVLGQKHPRELPKPPALAFKMEKPVTFTLGNGIRVYYLQDTELPLVWVLGYFRGGSLYEPAAKVGLAPLMATVLRTGGSKTRPGDKINEELEFISATVEAMDASEFMSVTGNALKKDFAKLVEVYADLVMNPAFPQDKLDLARNQTLEGMRRRWDQPMQVGSFLFNEKLYGADTPYGRRATPATLKAVTREDLAALHQRFFAPNNLMLGVAGDVPLDQVKALLNRVFKGWAKRKVELPEPAPLTERADGTIYYAYKDTPQANVFLGHLGVRRNNPDQYKLDVLNDIFGGGGFTARLMKELRSNRGLTYGIYGGIFADRDRGPFQVASPLKAAQLVEALGLIKGIIQDLQTNLVSDEEIETAKNSIINSFVFRFEQKNRIMSGAMLLKLRGYADTYYDTYIDNIRKVTKQDVLEVAKKYMDPAKMIILVVGDEKKFEKPLSSLGTVKPIDLKALMEAERGPQK